MATYIRRTPGIRRIYYGLSLQMTDGKVGESADRQAQPKEAALWCDKEIFLFREPARGEIVVVKSPDNKRFVKRIIAIGGDVLEIKDKDVYLNMTKLEEPYVIHTRKDERLVDDNYGPVTVPEGHFFVMGDNRDSSDDSRNWASPFLARKDITGKVLK